MAGFSDALQVATSGMQAQASRLRFISENIANADTPGYRRKEVAFAPDPAAPAGAVVTGPVRLDSRAVDRIYDPGNPLADAEGYRDGSNVDLVIEIADAREASRSYEANLRIFDQIRQMSAALTELLRR